jgi:LacI family transcriptional regulator
MADAGVPVDEALVRVGGYKFSTAEGPAYDLLTDPDRPTAVFAANDLSAIATMDVAAGLGLAVPDHLSVIGFDNVPESALSSPALTTIAQPIQQMGAEALSLLVDLIEGVERDTHIRLPTELIVRASCRPVDAGTGASAPAAQRRTAPRRVSQSEPV